MTSRPAVRATAAVAAVGWAWVAVLVVLGILGADVRRHHFEAAGIALATGLVLLAILPTPPVGALPCTAPVPRGWLVALAGLACARFAWTLGLGPLSDDYVLRAWAVQGEFMPQTWPYWRPLPLALWSAAVAAGGDWGVLHAINVALHITNVILVARLAAGCFGPLSGVVAGVAFLLFPAHAEAVAWTAGVFDLTATFGVLLALTAWCSPLRGFTRPATVLLGSAISLLAKETAIALPALLVLVQLCVGRTDNSAARRTTFAAVGLLVAGFMLFRALGSAGLMGHLEHLPTGRYQLKEFLVRPFAGVVIPLRTDLGIGIQVWLGALAFLVLLAVIVSRRAGFRAPAVDPAPSVAAATGLRFGLLWPLLAAAPLLSEFFVSSSLEGSRYLYLPAVGVALFVSSAFSPNGQWSRHWAAFGALIVLLAVWTLAGYEERGVWRHAAALRDAVLRSAVLAADEGNCQSLTLQNAPDSFNGAFIFRVGSAEALADALGDRSEGARCIGEWTGNEVRITAKAALRIAPSATHATDGSCSSDGPSESPKPVPRATPKLPGCGAAVRSEAPAGLHSILSPFGRIK